MTEKERKRQYYLKYRDRFLAKAKERYPQIRELRRVYNRTYKAKHPQRIKDSNRRWMLKKEWGLTLDQYAEMETAQHGVCGICQKPESLINPHTKKPYSLQVDHNHRTGALRGLLCHKCNKAIGLLNEDVMAAFRYLEKYENR